MLFELHDVVVKTILKIKKFTICEGKITCIVGKSGGGKTTLLRVLNKMVTVDQGTVVYKGKQLSDIDSIALRHDVVMMAQKPFIFPTTVKDNLVKGLTYRGIYKDDDVLKAVLDEVGLDKKLMDNAKVLSGGEAQRLALARVMLLPASCILLDEPSSALDDETERDVIEGIVSFVKRTGKTLVMVTHSKEVAKEFGDIIYTLQNGEIKVRDLNGR